MPNFILSPRTVLVVIATVCVLVLYSGLYWKGRSDEAARQRPRTEAALAQAAVAGLETQGARATVARVDEAALRRDAATSAVARLSAQLMQTEAAREPLDADRVARLRANDLELCRAAPELAGCAAD